MADQLMDTMKLLELIKLLSPYIGEEEIVILKKLSHDYENFNALKNRYGEDKHDDAVLTLETCIGTLFEKELSLRTTLCDIYMTLPDPADAKGRWDYGREQALRQRCIESIKAIKMMVDEFYQDVKHHHRKVTVHLDKANNVEIKSPDDNLSDNKPDKSATIYRPSLYKSDLNQVSGKVQNLSFEPDEDLTPPLIIPTIPTIPTIPKTHKLPKDHNSISLPDDYLGYDEAEEDSHMLEFLFSA